MSTVQEDKKRIFYLTSNIEPDGRFPGQASFAYFFFFGSFTDVCKEFGVIIGKIVGVGSVIS
jgi:hypothetical protein